MPRSKDAPVPFIQCDRQGKLLVTDEARSYLGGLGPGSVGVASVAGVYRTGP